ncbi:MAG: hypothetical protein PHP75_00955 [Methylacidiphilaceae bacterium]|nr:hypothetical protein [Candidatus Methylacidiphilaceae bacterium]
MRAKTPYFVAEFPLRTTAADEIALSRRLDAARQVYNAALGESLRRLALLRQSKDWQHAPKMPKTVLDEQSGKRIANKERSSLFRKTQERFGFRSFSLQKFAESCRDACAVGEHLGSHDMQSTSRRAFQALQQHAFGVCGRPRFKPASRFHSPKDKRGWQRIALEARTKYVRIVRRTIRGRSR